jgi:hypothetical protein
MGGEAMGKTSNISKQRWNSAHYTQISVRIAKDTAGAFKAMCKARDMPIAGTLARLMAGAAALPEPPPARPSLPNFETRGRRRKAVGGIVQSLLAIRGRESQYMEGIPENMRGGERHEEAERCVDALGEAIDILEGAY